MKTECWQKNKGSNGSKVFSFFNYNKFQAVIAIIVLFFTYHLAHSQQISFTPDSIEAAITNCGDSVTEQLVISNAGSSVLNYNIYLPLEVVLNNLNINYTQIIDSIPNRYDFTDGVTGTNISDGTGDMYDGGNYLGTNLGQYISYSDNSINTSSYLGTNCSYFTRKYTGLFVFCAELNGINYFEITGNLGADGGGSVDTARIHYQYFGKDYYGYIKRVYNAGDPSVNHLIIVNTDTLTQEYATSTDNDYHRINNLSGITRIYYLLYAGSSGNYIDSAATVSIMQGFIKALHSGYNLSYLSLSKTIDTVTAGLTDTIYFKYLTQSLYTGTYRDTLLIVSNDISNDSIVYKSILNYSGNPQIELSTDSIVMDTIMQYASTSDTLTIYNTGCDTLNITNMLVTTSEFTLDTTDLVILPFDSAKVGVTFSTSNPGSYADSIEITNDDVDTVVYLNAVAINAPVITVIPSSFDVPIAGCGEKDTLELIIKNTGEHDLIFNIIQENDFYEDFESGLDNWTWNGNWGITTNAYDGVGALTESPSGNYGNGWNQYIELTEPLTVINSDSCSLSYWHYRRMEGCCDYFSTQISVNGGGWQTLASWYSNEEWNLKDFNLSGYLSDNDELRVRFLFTSDGSVTYDGVLIDNLTISSVDEDLSWSGLSLNTDTVINGDSSIIDIYINTTELIEGTYTCELIVNSNDPVTPSDTVPLSMTLTGEPVIEFSTDTVVFDTIMQYANNSQSCWIKNTGCDTLTVTSITFTDTTFSVDTSSFEIVPFDSLEITITSSPVDTGYYLDTVFIYNNAGDTLVILSGYAYSPPVINLSPDLFDINFTNCEDSTVTPLIIKNTGDTALTWSIKVEGHLSPGDMLSFEASEYVLIPNSTDFDVTYLTIEAWVFCGNYNQNGHIFEKGPVNTQYSLFFEGSNICFRTYNSGGSGDSYYVNSNSIGITNDEWHHITAVYDGSTKKIYVDGIERASKSYSVTLRTGQVGQIIGAYGGSGSHSYYFNGYIDELKVWNVARTQEQIQGDMYLNTDPNSTGLVAYWDFNEGTGSTVFDLTTNDHDGTITNAEYFTSLMPMNFIVLDSVSGTISSGDSAEIDVKFYTKDIYNGDYGINTGDYSGIIIASSNDPVTPVDTIDYDVNLTGYPIIEFSTDTVAFDTILQFESTKDTLIIYNTGCDSLFITNITSTNNTITFDTNQFVIPPNDQDSLFLTSSPVDTGTYLDSLTIYNNAEDSIIILSGYAINPPIITYYPDSLNISLTSCGELDSLPLTIKNTGDYDLIYDIDKLQNSSAFDGSGDYITITSIGDLTEFTIEFWRKSTGSGTGSYPRMLSGWYTGSNNGGNDGFVFEHTGNNQNTISVWMSPDGSNKQIGTATISQNVWHHIALTFNGTEAILFVDNIQQGSNTFSSATSTINYLQIGGDTTLGRYFNGLIDEVRIWNYARTGAEIASTMYISLSGSEQGLVGYWNFDDNTVNDITSNNNNGMFRGNATTTESDAPIPGWLSFSLSPDTIISGDSTIIDIKFDSDGISAGSYTSDIIISSNDPLSPSDTVPVSLTLTGNPVIEFSVDTIVFDTIMQYSSTDETIWLFNTGCDTLVVTNIIASDTTFIIDSTTFTISPFDSLMVTVTSSPIDSGVYLDSITIYNNVGDTTVILSGYAFSPPVLNFDPDSFNVSLFACNDSSSSDLKIVNSGDTTLIVELELLSVSTGSKIDIALLGADYANYNNDVYTKLNNTGRFNTIDIYQVNSMTPTLEQLLNYDAVLVWTDYTFANSTLIGDVLADYVDAGRGVVVAVFGSVYGPIGGRFNSDNYWVIPTGGYTSGSSSMGTIYDPDHYLLNEVSSLNPGSSCYRPSSTSVVSGATRIVDWADGRPLIAAKEINGVNRVDLGFWPPSNDIAGGNWDPSTDGDVIMANALFYASGTINDWFTADVLNDSISAGDSTLIPIKFYGEGLVIGSYNSKIIINSNDPLKPTDTIPVSLTLTGDPVIEFSEDTIVFDTIMQYTSTTDSLWIFNSGCDTLTISSITTTDTTFKPDTNSLTVLPFDSTLLYIESNPLDTGIYLDTLFLFNNDIDTFVILSQYIYSPPIFSYSPDSFDILLTECDDSIILPLTIYNTGDTSLIINIQTIGTGSGNFLELATPTFYSTTSSTNYGRAIGIYAMNSFTITKLGIYGNLQSRLYDVVIYSSSDGHSPGSVLYTYSATAGGTGMGWNDIELGNSFTFNEGSYYVINWRANDGTSSWGTIELYNDSDLPYDVEPLTIIEGLDQYNATNAANTTHPFFRIGIPDQFYTFSSTSDTIASDDSTIINIKFKSTGLVSDLYQDTVTINTNDPLNPSASIPVSLTLTGDPAIELSANTIIFDTILQYTSTTDSLCIYNTGCDTLIVTNIVASDTTFSIDTTSFSIEPFDSLKVSVTSSPVDSGSYIDTLYIYNNDVDTFVILLGYSLSPPIITYNPLSYDLSITSCNDSIILPFTIYNTGESDLLFELLTQQSGTGSEIELGPTPNYYGYASGVGSGRGLGFRADKNFTLKSVAIRGSLSSMLYDVVIYSSTDGHTAGTQLYSYTTTAGGTGYGWNEIQLGSPFKFTSGSYYLINWRANNASTSWGSIEFYYDSGLPFVVGPLTMLEGYSDYNPTPGNTLHPYFRFTLADTWLYPSLSEDTIPPEDSSVIDMKFKATGVVEGVYNDTIIINSNDPLSPTDTIPVTLTLTGDPVIELSKDTVVFDSILQYTSTTDSLWIINTGCDTLIVTSIDADVTTFTIDTISFSILPFDSLMITITSSPVDSGAYSDTLYIYNNDVDTSVILNGYVFSPPIIEYYPDSYNVSFTSCGEKDTLELTIKNTGDYDLIFNIDYQNFYDDFESGLDNWTWNGNWGITTNAYYGTGALTESPSGNYGNSWNQYIELANSLTVINADSCALSYWHYRRMEGCCDYFFTQISVNGGGWQTLASWYDNEDWNLKYFDLSGYVNNNDELKIRFLFTSDGSVTYDGVLVDNLLVNLGYNTFCNLAVDSDTVPKGDSAIIDVYFNSEGLREGYYTSEVIINSNDPLNPSDTIPVSMTLTGDPEIGLSEDTIVFDSIMQYTSTTYNLWIYNNGCDTLTVTNINPSVSKFTIDTTSFSVLPFNSFMITITSSPVDSGSYSDTLYIYSNDVDTTVILNGYAYSPPVMVIDPLSYNVSLTSCDDSITHQLTIENTGDSDLEYIIHGGQDIDSVLNICPHTSSYSGDIRGYWYIAPIDHVITKLRVPTDVGLGQQNIQVMLFDEIPPNYSNSTTSYTTLFYSNSVSGTNWVDCDISVSSGDIIGIFGARGTGTHTTSYGQNNYSSSIDGNAITLTRLLYQGSIASGPTSGSISSESGGSLGRIEMTYTTKTIPDYISFSTYADTIISGGSQIIDVKFNATGVISGIYNDSIIISSNDPLNPADTISITLSISGDPVIELSTDTVVFDTVMQYTSTFDSLWIYNTGCDTLFITNISPTDIVYTPDTNSLSILPFDSALITITYEPQTFGDIIDTLYINNNDVDTSVILSSYVYKPPIISFTPNSFDISTTSCIDTIISQLKIYNTGDTTLNWNLSGSITQGGTIIVTTTTMFHGVYWGYYDGPGNLAYNCLMYTIGNSGLVGCYDYGGTVSSYYPVVETNLNTQYSTSYDFVQINNLTDLVTNGQPNYDVIVSGYDWSVAGIHSLTEIEEYLEAGGNIILAGNGSFSGQIPFLPYSVTNTSGSSSSFPGPAVDTDHELAQNVQTGEWGYDSELHSYIPAYDTDEYDAVFSIGITCVIVHDGDNLPHWIQPDSIQGSTLKGDSTILNILFDPACLESDAYQFNMYINSNDPLTPTDSVLIDYTINGDPVIEITEDTITFDTIIQFTCITDSMWIYNTGCDTLNVTNITVSDPMFTIDTTTVTIAPFDSLIIHITSCPLDSGVYSHSMTIYNNAGNITCILEGYALSPPIITYSPLAFDVSITTCNDSVILPLTIYNTGNSDLTWSTTGAYGGMGNNNVLLIGVDSRFETILNNEGYNVTTVASDAIYDGTNPDPDGFSCVVLANGIDYISDMPISGQNALVNYVNNGGGFLCHEWIAYEVNSGRHLSMTDIIPFTRTGGNTSTDNYTVVQSHPVTEGVSSTFATPNHGFSEGFANSGIALVTGAITGDAVIAKEYGSGRIVHFASAGTYSGLDPFLNSDMERLFINSIEWLSSAQWLSLDTTGSDINPDDSIVVNVKFNTLYLSAGSYTSEIIISSNDPFSPSDTIPMALTLTGDPVIELSEDSVVFDSIMQFSNIDDTLWITNAGCDTLFVTNVTNNLSIFNPLTIAFSVAPYHSVALVINFAPLDDTTYFDTLYIYNNDVNQIVPIRGTAYKPPVIFFDEDSIGTSITACYDTDTIPFVIRNIGDTSLIFNVNTSILPPWLSFVQTSGSVNPDDSIIIQAVFNSSGINSGVYDSLFIINSNDPLSLTDTILCTFNMIGYPSISISNTNVDMGYIAQYSTVIDSVWIYNNGCDTLEITNITSTDADFNVDTASFSVPYNDSVKVKIIFNPQNDIVYTDTLTILNNDVTTYIYLTGEAYSPPIIAFDEVSISASITVCNETDTVPFTINNIGDTTLIFSVDTTSLPVWLSFIENTDTILPGDFSVISAVFNSNGVNAGVYNSIFMINSNDPLSPVDTIACTLNMQGYSIISLSSTTLNMGYIAQYSSVTDSVWVYNTGCDTLLITNVTSTDSDFSAESTNFYVAPDDSVSLKIIFNPQIDMVYTDTLTILNNDVTRYIYVNGEAYSPPIISFDEESISSSITSCNESDTVPFTIRNTGDTTLIFNVDVASLPTWLSFIQISDTVLSGGSSVISAVFNSTGINAGIYNSTFMINSNDPLSPVDTIACTLNMQGYPIISLSVTEISFDTVQYAQDTAGVWIFNFGCDTLFISSIYTSHTDFTAMDASLSIAPADSTLLNVIFSPSEVTTYSEILTLINNDVDTNVTLTGIGTPRPIFSSNVNSLSVSMGPCEDSVAEQFTVYNTGVPDLIVTIDSAGLQLDGITFISVSETISNNDSVIIGLLFDASKIGDGIFVDSFTINTNDPLNNPFIFYLNLDIERWPVILTVHDTGICYGDLNPVISATGTNLQWYSDPGLDTVITGSSAFTPPDTELGTYDYYVTQSDGVSCVSSPETLNFTVAEKPLPPIAIDDTICSNETLQLMASGTNIKWYSDSSLDTLIYTGNTLIPPDSLPGKYYYYLTQAPVGCVSDKDTAVLTIYQAPPSPAVADTGNCINGQVPDLIASGYNILWYSDPLLNNKIFSGDTFAAGIDSTIISSYTYYIIDSAENGCISNVHAVTLSVSTKPASPSIADNSACTGQQALLIGTDESIKWYNNDDPPAFMYKGKIFNTGLTLAGNYEYYAASDNFGCESELDTVQLTIIQSPPQPIANDTAICYGSENPVLLAQGTDIKWYNNPALVFSIQEGDTLILNNNRIGNYLYYATQTQNGCESVADTVILTINPAPFITWSHELATNEQGEKVLLLHAYNANEYSWSPETGLDVAVGSVVTVLPSEIDVYTLTGTNIEGCSSSINISVVDLRPSTFIDEQGYIRDLRLYPNPTGGEFTIEFSVATNEIVTINFVNSSGQLFKSQEVMPANGFCQHNFDIREYNDGEYILQIITEYGVFYEKLIYIKNIE